MNERRTSAVLPAGQVKLHSRPLLIGDQCRAVPKITLKRDGDRIRTIEIVCGCGERIILDCEYDARS